LSQRRWDPKFNRFGTVPACDSLTDRSTQDNSIYHASIESCSKNDTKLNGENCFISMCACNLAVEKTNDLLNTNIHGHNLCATKPLSRDYCSVFVVKKFLVNLPM